MSVFYKGLGWKESQIQKKIDLRESVKKFFEWGNKKVKIMVDIMAVLLMVVGIFFLTWLMYFAI